MKEVEKFLKTKIKLDVKTLKKNKNLKIKILIIPTRKLKTLARIKRKSLSKMKPKIEIQKQDKSKLEDLYAMKTWYPGMGNPPVEHLAHKYKEKFARNICNCKAGRRNNLWKHVRQVHVGTRYNCGKRPVMSSSLLMSTVPRPADPDSVQT